MLSKQELVKQGTGANLQVSLKDFKAPLPRPSTTARVALRQTPLPEERYTAALQRIVERDYFPELPFLRAKQALDDALQTRDPQRIKAAYSELRRCSVTPTSGRKLGTPVRGAGLSSGRFTAPGTPRSSFSGASGVDRDMSDTASTIMEQVEEEDDIDKLVKGKSLDQFASRFTSEDNYSASEIMLNDAQQLENSRMWVHEHAAEYNLRQQLLLKHGPRQEDGTLNMYISAPYDEKQSLMHYVPQTEHTSKTSAEDSRRPPKEISTAATRVGKAFLNAQAGVAALTGAAKNLVRAASEIPESPKVNGFGFICTPSPCPGVDDDPIFTWGSVEGTPLLLPEDDCPGFHPFKVQEQSLRERVATDLGKKKTVCGVKKTIAKPSSVSRPHTPGTPRLSEAAKMLARRALSAMADGVTADPQLRASYRRSTPLAKASGVASARGATPSTSLTPRSGLRSPCIGTIRDHTPRRAAASMADAGSQNKHLTDGLLEL